MCGIIGYIGKYNGINTLDLGIEALKRLEYRGYDSAGVAVVREGALAVRRSAGKLSRLEEAIRLDPIEGGQRLANFIHACGEEVKILTMLSGHRSIQELSPEDLRAMDLNTAALTGLKLAGYDRPLPMWEEGFGLSKGKGNGHNN